MEAISVQKVQALIQCLERLYSAETLKQFLPTVFTALSEIIEGCVFSLDIINLKTGEMTNETSDNFLMSPKIENRMVKLVRANPAIPMVRTTQWQFEQTPLNLDVFAPIGVQHQTVVTLSIPGHAASVTVNRGTNLTDEEALLLSLVAPHMALAYRNLQRLESLRAAADQVIPGPQDLERIGLTPREAEVLHWVMKGKQDAVIAGILKISIRTVHQHIAHILRKLQSESRSSAGYEAMMKLKGLESHPRAA
jgi:DNA-binding CsgD family transcriptional regulator